MATRFLQTLYYNVTIRAGSPRPQPGQPRFAEHYRRIYILVICVYLAFTIYEADWELQRSGDFYSILGVAPDANSRDIKKRYRQLSALMHPDKAGSAAATAPFDVDSYIRIQTAHETLTDEAKRFAYDRFGPDVLLWKDCTVIRDYVMKGARDHLLGYYGIGAAALYVLPKLGYFRDATYWRVLALAALLLLEVYTITRGPAHPWFLDEVVNPVLARLVNPVLAFWWGARAMHPPFLPFQAVALARRMSLTLSIALNQVVPYLTADTRAGRLVMRKRSGADAEAAQTAQSVDELEKAVRVVGEEARRMVQMEVTPFAGNQAVIGSLRGKVKRWLVDNTVRNDPMTRAAIGARIARRRPDAPAGAQGNGVRMRTKAPGAANGDA